MVWVPFYDRATGQTHWRQSSKEALDKIKGWGRATYYSEPERGGSNVVHEAA